MKITKFLTLLFICAIFSCNHTATANFTLVVAPPPAYILDKAAKNLSVNDELTKVPYVVKASIRTWANDSEIANAEVTAQEGDPATINFKDITAQNDLYAYIEIGYQYPGDKNTGELARFEPIYSGCSDLFDVANGETKSVSIVAVKNDRFGFTYRETDDSTGTDADKYFLTYKNNENYRSANFDKISLSDKTVKFAVENTTYNDAKIVKGIIVGDYFYGVFSSTNYANEMNSKPNVTGAYYINNIFKINLSSLSGNEIIISNFVNCISSSVSSCVSTIKDCYQFGNYLVIRIAWWKHPEGADRIYEGDVVYLHSLSDTSNKMTLTTIKFHDDNDQLGSYVFPFTHNDKQCIGIYKSISGGDGATITFYQSSSLPGGGQTWSKKGWSYIKGYIEMLSDYKPLVLPHNDGFLIFTGNGYVTIPSDQLSGYLENTDTDKGNLNITSFFTNDDNDTVFANVGLDRDHIFNRSGAFSYITGYRYGDNYYAVSNYGLFVFSGLKSGSLKLEKRYLCFDLYNAYIWQNNFYAFCSNHSNYQVNYTFKKDLLKLTTVGKLPKLYLDPPDSQSFTLENRCSTFEFNFFKTNVSSDKVTEFEKLKCYMVNDGIETEIGYNGDNGFSVDCNEVFKNYDGNFDATQVDFILKHENWDDSEPTTETINYYA